MYNFIINLNTLIASLFLCIWFVIYTSVLTTKSKKDLIDNSIKNEFISSKEYALGFEGLISDRKKAYELFGDEAIYEKCTLEDILLYYTRRE